MNIFALPSLPAAATALTAGGLVCFKDARDPLSRAFLLLAADSAPGAGTGLHAEQPLRRKVEVA